MLCIKKNMLHCYAGPMAPLFLLIALLAFQLSPALTPTKTPQPALPKIDQNACPFEGCQFGSWILHEPVQIYDTWKSRRKLLRTLGNGEEVTAVTGIHITFEPAEIRVTAPIAAYGLRTGDTVFGYMKIGEGFFNAWFNGNWVDEFDRKWYSGVGQLRMSPQLHRQATEGRAIGVVGHDQDEERNSRLDQGRK
jgi:hypothetical protein